MKMIVNGISRQQIPSLWKKDHKLDDEKKKYPVLTLDLRS